MSSSPSVKCNLAGNSEFFNISAPVQNVFDFRATSANVTADPSNSAGDILASGSESGV